MQPPLLFVSVLQSTLEKNFKAEQVLFLYEELKMRNSPVKIIEEGEQVEA